MPDQEPPEENVNLLTRARDRLIERHQCTEEEADAMLRNTLQILLEEPNPPPEPPQEPPEPPATPPLDVPRPPNKKKATYMDFDQNATIASRIPHYPSEYAVGKIEDYEYVELWYFTTEGCNEASKATPTTADEAFNLLNTKSGLALQPIKATKASPNAIMDEQLSWEQITTARHMMIATANRVGWAQKLTLALAQLYIGLEGLKAEGKSTRALILYHAVARKLWHDALQGRGDSFNISLINLKLLDLLENQVRDSDNDDMRRIAMDAQRQMLDLQRQASNSASLPEQTNLKTNILRFGTTPPSHIIHLRFISLRYAYLPLPPLAVDPPTPRDSPRSFRTRHGHHPSGSDAISQGGDRGAVRSAG